MSDNLPERVQILCHSHIICITVLENRIICCQLFCDLLLKSALERIFNVLQLILVKYLIQKFHDIGLSYYFKESLNLLFYLSVLTTIFFYKCTTNSIENRFPYTFIKCFFVICDISRFSFIVEYDRVILKVIFFLGSLVFFYYIKLLK